MKIIEVPEYIRGLIFDCDGTLVDSMPLHMKAWEHAITQAGGKWDYGFIFSKKGMQGKDILASYNDSFGMNLDVEETARVKTRIFPQVLCRDETDRCRCGHCAPIRIKASGWRLPQAVREKMYCSL